MKRNLLMSFFTEFPFEDLEPFIASFVANVPNTDLVFFTFTQSELIRFVCARKNIKLIDATHTKDGAMHFFIMRFLLWRDYLREHVGEYDKVMIADTRDLFFQGNPFAVELERDVCMAAEDGIIGPEFYNSTWIRSAYGEEVLAGIYDRPISCSGTTLGTAQGMLQYLTDISTQIQERHAEGKAIFDQGAHNYIAWSLNPPYCYVDLHDRVFQTVGLTAAERIEIRGGLVLVDQAVAPVIHQWDRHPALAQHVAGHPRFRIL